MWIWALTRCRAFSCDSSGIRSGRKDAVGVEREDSVRGKGPGQPIVRTKVTSVSTAFRTIYIDYSRYKRRVMMTLESAKRRTRSTMHPGMVHWVVLFCVLCRGLCTLTYAAEQTITRTVEEFTLGMPQDQALTL